MAFLIGIALADGTFSEAEREALYQVAALLSLPQREVDQLISMANAQAQFQERYSSQSDYRAPGRVVPQTRCIPLMPRSACKLMPPLQKLSVDIES